MMKGGKKNPKSKRIGCLGWGLILIGGILALLILLFLAAFITEKVFLAQLPEKYPPPGEMVSVGPYRLHLYCTGEATASPVVVVSPGSGGNVLDWALVQPEVAKFTRICAYDRYGSGWSFGDPHGQTYQEEANDLHRLLQNAAVEGPYILAGDSYGGAVMQVYASMFPREVVGIVEIDAVTCGMDTKYPEKYLQTLQIDRQVVSAFSTPGLFRLMNWFGMSTTVPAFEKLSPGQREMMYALTYNSRMGVNMKVEQATRQARDEQFMAAGPLPDVPMIVLVRGLEDSIQGMTDEKIIQQAEQAWRQAQADLAAQVRDGILIVVEGSGHFISLEKPELVIDAIRTIVEKVSGK
jgi:pimeloyl-ACP methyl ester carboxylesterase